MGTTKGSFKSVPIGHEFKFGSYVAKKLDASNGEIKYPSDKREIRYFSPCQWVEYNPIDPELCRTDMNIH